MTEQEMHQALRDSNRQHWKVSGGSVRVSLPDGRKQTVDLSVTTDSIQLESPITPAEALGSPMDSAAFLTAQHEGLIATRLRLIDGWIIARTELPIVGLTHTELLDAVQDLAVAADRLEWLVTGEDRQ